MGTMMLASILAMANGAIDLSGPWTYTLDAAHGRARGEILLPGSLERDRIGDAPGPDSPWTGGFNDRSFFTDPRYAPYRQKGNFRVPGWLQPDTLYRGSAVFSRTIAVPESWRGKVVHLLLERPHWTTRVRVDGTELGACDSLGTPHEYVLGALAPGSRRLDVEVSNVSAIPVGGGSHSVTDYTQGNWLGVVGNLALWASEPSWIDDLQVYARVRERSIRIVGLLGGAPYAGEVRLTVGKRSTAVRADGRFEAALSLGPDAKLWDEFAPNLHTLTARLDNGEARSVRFGLREFRANGTRFEINGRPTMLRGTLDCAAFPRTGHPPTDVASWRRVLRTMKAYGLNHVRFHSWCPPEAAFAAADELGVYLQPEMGAWSNVGDGTELDRWLYRETDAILRAYGNHPSFVMAMHGNEPAGSKSGEYLGRWVEHFKAKDPRRMFSSGAGWPEIPENAFHSLYEPRIQLWGAGLGSRINALAPETRTDYRKSVERRRVPLVSHEIGQWCVYPNFAEMPKYTGYLKPKNFGIFRDFLTHSGMIGQARDFLMASGKLQTLCYKEEIESALRTPGMGGFQLLGLSDFPGQGSAIVGLTDAFYEAKPYVKASEVRRFCGPTVPLARLDKRVFTSDETLVVDVEVAHFGPSALRDAVLECRLVDGAGTSVLERRITAGTIEVGAGRSLGRVRLPLAGLAAPSKYRLTVGLAGTRIENDWDVWVYPQRVEMPEADVLQTNDEGLAIERASQGATIVLRLDPRRLARDVALGFSSIFWNTSWTQGQAPHTLGVLVDPKHPLFESFPTEYHSNWQWWYLVHSAGAMVLDGLPKELRPTIQVVDDWFTARKLGLMFEARLGKGRLVATTIDLQADDPVSRQFRVSLLRYLAGPRFRPSVEVSPEQLRSLLRS